MNQSQSGMQICGNKPPKMQVFESRKPPLKKAGKMNANSFEGKECSVQHQTGGLEQFAARKSSVLSLYYL